MSNLLNRILGRRNDQDGASAVEYGLLIGAIAAVIIIVIFALGGIVRDVFRSTCDDIESHTTTTTTCAN